MAFEEILCLFNSSIGNRNLVRLNLLEAGMMFKLAKEAPGDIIEIGTKFGGSAVLMASAIEDDRKIYTIDIIAIKQRQKGREVLNCMPERLLNRIQFINNNSNVVAKTWNKPLGLVFVDGEHNGHACKQDINSWRKDGFQFRIVCSIAYRY